MLPRVLPTGRRLSRRGVLLGTASAAVLPAVTTGCTRHKPHVPTPRETLLDETLALEDVLLSAYDVALAAFGRRSALTPTLVHIRAEHAAHRAALIRAGAQPAPEATPSPTPAAIAPAETTRTLAATERAAATIRTDTCVRAPRDLAPLLGSLAASESAHAALLREPG
jgi:hypothetical protein